MDDARGHDRDDTENRAHDLVLVLDERAMYTGERGVKGETCKRFDSSGTAWKGAGISLVTFE